MRIAALIALLAACDAGKKPAPPPAPTPQAPPVGSAPPMTIDAAVLEAIAVDAPPSTDARPSDPVVARPALPNGELGITWLVYPPSVPLKRDPQILQQPVTLEIQDGGVTLTTELPPQFGALQPYNQSACKGDAYPLAKDEIAKITFYEGGAGGFFVKRRSDWLDVYSWAQTDGLCGTVDKPVECPKNAKLITSLNIVHVKTDAKVVESIVEIAEKGVRQPFDCSAR